MKIEPAVTSAAALEDSANSKYTFAVVHTHADDCARLARVCARVGIGYKATSFIMDERRAGTPQAGPVQGPDQKWMKAVDGSLEKASGFRSTPFFSVFFFFIPFLYSKGLRKGQREEQATQRRPPDSRRHQRVSAYASYYVRPNTSAPF